MTTPTQTPYRGSSGSRADHAPLGPNERYSGRTVVAIGLCAAAIAGIIATAAFAVATHHDSSTTADADAAPAVSHDAKTDPRAAHPSPRSSSDAVAQLLAADGQ